MNKISIMLTSGRRDCAGFILFRKYNANLQVLLIRENQKKVPIGFPKGKIESGETPLEAARRELYEETTISHSDIHPTGTQVVEPFYLDKTPHIYYYVAVARKCDKAYSHTLPPCCFWENVDNVEKMTRKLPRLFHFHRYNLLKEAQKHLLVFPEPL